eukprot:CAMPEP_0197857172 /NCGR_PEP_ID=MMETSP1438-20131217/29987_1 /TAXON_ID=1461541 /ORGANISM="Pterosperma sp., Strain CCMP1384" /LENGTH=620 /DNA_ID=CAMNT_0043472901 /DNA_START=38 /DNA_END=1897 /DNA_ORIENTATION=-
MPRTQVPWWAKEQVACCDSYYGMYSHAGSATELEFDLLSYRTSHMLDTQPKPIGSKKTARSSVVERVEATAAGPLDNMRKLVSITSMRRLLAGRFLGHTHTWLQKVGSMAQYGTLVDPTVVPPERLPLEVEEKMKVEVKRMGRLVVMLRGVEDLKKLCGHHTSHVIKERLQKAERMRIGCCRRLMNVLATSWVHVQYTHKQKVNELAASLDRAAVEAILRIHGPGASGFKALTTSLTGGKEKEQSVKDMREADAILDLYRGAALVHADWLFNDAIHTLHPPHTVAGVAPKKQEEVLAWQTRIINAYKAITEYKVGTHQWYQEAPVHYHNKLTLLEVVSAPPPEAANARSPACPSPLHCLELCEEIATGALFIRTQARACILPASYISQHITPHREHFEALLDTPTNERIDRQCANLLNRLQNIIPTLRLLQRSTTATGSPSIFIANRTALLLATLLANSLQHNFQELSWMLLTKILHSQLGEMTIFPFSHIEYPQLVSIVHSTNRVLIEINKVCFSPEGTSFSLSVAAECAQCLHRSLLELAESSSDAMQVLLQPIWGLMGPMMGGGQERFTVETFVAHEDRASEFLRNAEGRIMHAAGQAVVDPTHPLVHPQHQPPGTG